MFVSTDAGETKAELQEEYSVVVVVRASRLRSRAPLFLPPLSVACFLLYPAQRRHHHHLSLSLSLVAVGHNSLDFLRRSVVGRWREWPRKWRQKGRSSTLCRMWQSTIVLTIAGSLSVARWRIHVLYGALSFLFVSFVFVCYYHCACFASSAILFSNLGISSTKDVRVFFFFFSFSWGRWRSSVCVSNTFCFCKSIVRLSRPQQMGRFWFA